jgi:S-DNA-T family DNA segregation ATPase FtsK/SpoIIIE
MDDKFKDAARIVVSSNLASVSTSTLQRYMGIGYNKAGKIMDQLEVAGIVGPTSGGKPRAVLVDSTQLEQILSKY